MEKLTYERINIMRVRYLIYIVIVLVIPRIGFSQTDDSLMYAHFIDVGQGDATLLEFPCGAILIDAGSQDEKYTDELIAYLNDFFSKRNDLNRTLESIIITHNHIDHTRALESIVQKFTVNRFIGNGQSKGIGTGNPNWVRDVAESKDIQLREITWEEVKEVTDRTGLTGQIIDPVDCEDADPIIRVFSGRRDEKPDGWTKDEFDNKNNHSIVIRIDFGESSFLFTGDLEEDAIDNLVEYYRGEWGGVLDVDVYQVGHHGSHNGTNEALVSAMTPEIAVISMGKWDFGKESGERFSTYNVGCPREVVVNLLRSYMSALRKHPITAMIAVAAKRFEEGTIKKRIYGTAWSGTIKLRANLNGVIEYVP